MPPTTLNSEEPLNPLMDIIRPMLISGTAFLRLRTNR